MPVARSSSAAKAGQRSRAARCKPSAPCSPKSASVTGASIPAATPEAPAPSSGARSTTSTDSPRSAARRALASPISPAPITTASYLLLRGSDITFPPPALPVSGSTVGGAAAALSARWPELP